MSAQTSTDPMPGDCLAALLEKAVGDSGADVVRWARAVEALTIEALSSAGLQDDRELRLALSREMTRGRLSALPATSALSPHGFPLARAAVVDATRLRIVAQRQADAA